MEIVIILVLLLIVVGFRAFQTSHYTLQRNIQSALTDAGVPSDEIDSCLRWAFGDDYENISLTAWGDHWRERHSDMFMICGYDLVKDSLHRIGKAYLERRRKV